MYKNNLLNSITKYSKNNPQIEFYKKCIENLNKISYDENDLLYLTPKNKYVLESIKYTICDNPSKYHIYLYNKKKKKCTNYAVTMNDKTKNTFFKDIPKINFKSIKGLNIINIVITSRPIKFDDIFYEFDDVNQLCKYDPNDSNNFAMMIAIKKIFGYTFNDNVCLPNMIIKNDIMTVFNDETINTLCEKTQKDLKNIYDIDMSLVETKKHLYKCHAHGFDIYKGIPNRDPDTDMIKKFHLDVKRNIYNKYCRNINFLFDAGCGRLTDLFYWNEAGIKNVYCVEPSKDSILSGKERLAGVKNKIKTKILVIEGVGDSNWGTDQKYNEIIKNKYDVITFQFTIHYMLDKFDILMKNLLAISKHGTKVIVTCMDGNLINEELNKTDKIEVRNNNNEIIFAIADAPNDNILVYLKGGYGMEHGSIEKLVNVNKLSKIFTENGYKQMERKPFLEYASRIKDQMTTIQKKVSKYYTSIVFEFTR